MHILIDPHFHMIFALFITLAAVVLFVREKLPVEVISIALLVTILLFGQVFSLLDSEGDNILSPDALLSGFSNPSLIAVLALLVMGQGIIQTDSLRLLSGLFRAKDRKHPWLVMSAFLFFIGAFSAVINDTPLVVIAIPLVQALARKLGISDSRVLMPLSFVAILGGLTTLIGSSTNLLVASSMTELGFQPLGFFDFIVPGVTIALVGFLYVVLVLPRFLPERASMVQDFTGSQKEFVAEIDVTPESKLVGAECVDGRFPALKNLHVKMIQRGGQLILPPFEGYTIAVGDILIVAATRENLADILSKFPGFLLNEYQEGIMNAGAKDPQNVEAHVLAEMMIPPASRLVDMSLDHINLERLFGVIVLGIQRRARVVQRRLGRIRLESGDVLLVAGKRGAVDSLRDSTDFIVLSGSKRELPVPRKAPLAIFIFFLTVSVAAFDILPIPVAAITGALMMLASGCLNIRQATRAIDRKIFLLVGSMLALGTLLENSGGARFLAESILKLPLSDEPFFVLSLFFLLIALTTNILSNNACAILFTPIAMSLAQSVNVPDDFYMNTGMSITNLFAVTVIFASNCSFATPIGYQTNLLVMGPGHYRFRDFMKVGTPLALLVWVTYMLLVHYYYGL